MLKDEIEKKIPYKYEGQSENGLVFHCWMLQRKAKPF